jgi:hypothetical protein
LSRQKAGKKSLLIKSIEIAADYHARNVRLFGSVPRGDDQIDSDIDFLVDFQPGSTLFDQVGLIDALSNKLGVRWVWSVPGH